MRLRKRIGVVLVLVGAGFAWLTGAAPLTLRRGGPVPVGPDALIHDTYLTIPAATPFVAVALAGLVVLALPGPTDRPPES